MTQLRCRGRTGLNRIPPTFSHVSLTYENGSVPPGNNPVASRPSSNTSEVSQHIHIESPGHTVTLDKVRILDTEQDYFVRGVKEAVYIRAHQPSLNRDGGRYRLPATFDALLTSSRFRRPESTTRNRTLVSPFHHYHYATRRQPLLREFAWFSRVCDRGFRIRNERTRRQRASSNQPRGYIEQLQRRMLEVMRAYRLTTSTPPDSTTSGNPRLRCRGDKRLSSECSPEIRFSFVPKGSDYIRAPRRARCVRRYGNSSASEAAGQPARDDGVYGQLTATGPGDKFRRDDDFLANGPASDFGLFYTVRLYVLPGEWKIITSIESICTASEGGK
ncbi:hypothetical protein Bbelb_398760 [Branchiostoma belcheri]|nr:hypothetical protein Bbelb_398760 [Branchiostoma belcheri]